MTEVAFHFNAADKLDYACRLLKKATANSAKVVVVGDTPLLLNLDITLWSLGPSSFIPHCVFGVKDGTLAFSPVVLVPRDELPDTLPHHQVLLNLGQELIKGFELFERIIEVVTRDEQDKTFARKRWKHYLDRGYPLLRHDLSVKTPAV
ncbi:MAG: DNA polymerase III subunit chi [Limnohabitans sp.]